MREKNLIVRIGTSPLCFSGHRLCFALRRGRYIHTHNQKKHTCPHAHMYVCMETRCLRACCDARLVVDGRRLSCADLWARLCRTTSATWLTSTCRTRCER